MLGTVQSDLHFDQNTLIVKATGHLLTLRGTEVKITAQMSLSQFAKSDFK